jgi:phosphoribosyl 1,2-cyclic phosphodiesterase/FixJ family two-component response regulator
MGNLKKKILIADDSDRFFAQIKNDARSHDFIIETVTSGKECLKKLETFQPDLVIVDFMLPEIHGIEILTTIKNGSLPSSTGVILTCYHGMIQNYRCAAKLGANYFLEKPYEPSNLFKIVDLYFSKELKLNSFPEKKNDTEIPSTLPFNRPLENSYLKFWGTRGSNPVAGMEYIQFGGNTPCLEIRHGQDLLIIDAGSGIRALGQELGTQANVDLNILISHTHWDHLLGFPFFLPLYQPKRKVTIYTPVGFEKETKELFSDMLAYSYFPVAISDIQSKLSFENLRDSETLTFGTITVSTHYAFHPGSTLCFKIDIAGKKIGYVTDNEFLQGCHLPPSEIEKDEILFTPYESLINFLQDCDILVHEAQYTQEEYQAKEGWGHSSIYNACALIKKANIKHWIVTHHDPKHTDAMLLEKTKLHKQTLKKMNHQCKVQLAYDGMLLSLDSSY